MIKYFGEYRDPENALHRFEIDDANYSGSPTEVQGYVELEYLDVDDVLEAIRGSALAIHLEADINLTFEDLYSEQERTFKVTYYRDGQIKFVGFMNPDGLYQDWVNDKWEISLDVSGGLGYLENLAYPASGEKEKEIEIISKCLARTGIELEICTNLLTTYEGQPVNTDVLDNVYQGSDRFVEDDGETTMDCEAVLRGVLEKYCASIYQFDGKWFVSFIPNKTLVSNSYYVYNANGTFNRMESFAQGTRIGSQINDFYPHHCSGNQRIEIQPSVGAYRINFKYGVINSINNNPGFLNDGVTLNGWDIITPSAVDLIPEGSVDIFNNNSGTSTQAALSSISGLLITPEQTLRIKVKAQTRGGAKDLVAPFRVRVEAIKPSGNRYLAGNVSHADVDLTWTDDPNRIVFADFDQDETYYTFEKSIPSLEDNFILNIIIYEVSAYISPSTAVRLDYFGIGIEPADSEAEGEFHTFERIANPSSVVRDTKDVIVADSPSNVYAGALYKNDQTSLTSAWIHAEMSGISILGIMGYLTMEAFGKPNKIFEGDVYGYVNYPGGYYIDGIVGQFIITSYKYNTKLNITEIKAIELGTQNVYEDTEYVKTIDYGESVPPTIK